MLTIQNVRRDIGTTIGEYTLSDGGLSSPPAYSGTGEYYSFHWKTNLNRTFKFLLDREPIEGKQSIYRIRLYDGNRVVQGTNKDGFVFETKVGKHLLNDRTDFYSFMLKTIELYK